MSGCIILFVSGFDKDTFKMNCGSSHICDSSIDHSNLLKSNDTNRVLTYQFRLYPNMQVERQLLFALEQSRIAYNCFLEELNNGERDINRIKKKLPEIRRRNPSMEKVNSHSLYFEAYHLLENLKAQARKKRNGRKVGRLRFRTPKGFKSFAFDRYGFKVERKSKRSGYLHLSKIGDIPIRLHREIRGQMKLAIIKRKTSGHWFVFIATESCESIEKREIRTAVGIDVGLESLVVDSDGLFTDNPRHHGKALKRLRREQRRLNRRKKGSRNRERQRLVVAGIYEHITSQRRDFLHKLSRYYVDHYDLIITEELCVEGMISGTSMASSIMDASWGILNRYLSYKAENAGRTFVRCNPEYSSIECSVCGALVPKTLGERSHVCDECGIKISRDFNASRNILKRGIEKVGLERPELTLVDIRPLRQLVLTQAGWLKQERLNQSKKSDKCGEDESSPLIADSCKAISHERSAHKD